MFKSTLVIVAIFFTYKYAGAQIPFYWYGDQKIYVAPDSTKFYVRLSKASGSDLVERNPSRLYSKSRTPQLNKCPPYNL
jgi:hypothetical protein